MPYTSQDKLIDRFGERMLTDLTDRASPPTGAMDADVIAQAMADADAIIDGYLASKYRLPLAEVPQQIADLATTIAIYKLHTYEPDKKITRDFDDAMRILRDIAAGTIRLPIAGIEPPGTSGSGVKTTDRDRPFTNDNLHGFV